MAIRDRHRTRSRILAAACGEFARMGFAGARIDEVAKVAKVNKRMIYHYFQSKGGLYAEVLHSRLVNQGPQHEPDNVVEALDDGFDPQALRLMTWEALTGEVDNIVAEPIRTRAWQRFVAAVIREQRAGILPTDMNPRALALALLAVRMFPRIYPHYSRMILAEDPNAADFEAGLDGFFGDLVGALRPGVGGPERKPRIRLKPVYLKPAAA